MYGNTRITFIDQKKDAYYSFGMVMNGLNYINESVNVEKNNYLYNGKELQTGEFEEDEFSLDWYEYGARFYDAQLGRFHTHDRFAESYYLNTPYHYTLNNTIKFIDVNGDSLRPKAKVWVKKIIEYKESNDRSIEKHKNKLAKAKTKLGKYWHKTRLKHFKDKAPELAKAVDENYRPKIIHTV